MSFEYVRGPLHPCWNCGKPTERVDICWEAHICSAECLAEIDERVGRELEQAETDIAAGNTKSLDEVFGRKSMMDQMLDSIEKGAEW